MPDKQMFMIVMRTHGTHCYYGDKPDDSYTTIHTAFVFAVDEDDAADQVIAMVEKMQPKPTGWDIAPANTPIEIGNVRY